MNYGPLIFLAALFAMGASWFGFIFKPQVQTGYLVQTNTVPGGAIYPNARPGLAADGLQVYRANGCASCHSQQVRQKDTVCDLYLNETGTNRNALLVTRVLNSHYVAPQAGQPTRNSTGYQVLLGLSDDSDGVWRYRVLVGWEDRVFQASAYKSHQAPIAEAALIWAPSAMTTVTARLTRSIEDAAQEGVVGYTYTSARLVVDHELLRNVVLQGYAGVQQANFLQGGGTSNGVSLGGGVTWRLNRNVRVAATYDFTDQHGSNSPTVQTSGSFTRNIGLLTLRLGM